ncbi:Hypothetical predicted protein [Cloeon dipterum]|uniref:RRM domain-containing protein n=1 Tax=Cloeon dipterum TaxID=197152 RepID=A0A8S1C6J3_9INSE|nr:Hypothetical predicted protein [Cloeon dipterum]
MRSSASSAHNSLPKKMRGMFRGNMMRGRGGPRGGQSRFSGPFQGNQNRLNPMFENNKPQQQQPPSLMKQQTQNQQANKPNQQPQQVNKPPAANNTTPTPQQPQQQSKPQGQQQGPAAQQTPKPAEKKNEAPVKAEPVTPAVKKPAGPQIGPQLPQAASGPSPQQKPPQLQQAPQQPLQIQQQTKPQNPPFQQQNQNQNFQSRNMDQQRNSPHHNQPRSQQGGGGGRDGGGGERKFNPFNRPFGGNNMNRSGGPRTLEERLNERVASLSGPTYDMPPKEDSKEVKFSGHCRLYVGNITSDTSEDDIKNLFSPFGEPSEIFVNKEKNFAFVKMDYRASAENAKKELDGTQRRGKVLKIRFAPHGAIIKVKNLTSFVSNELLETAFGVFGEIERAYIITDERGKSTGSGIVEFQRKPAATLAVRKCNENCFFLTSALRPVIVEMHEELSDPEGLPEKSIYRKSGEYMKEREMGPRFANINSFEHDYGTRWKQLFELRKQKLEAVEREMKLEEEKLEAQMEYAKYEHETEMLREQLRQREQDRDRQKRDWEMKERQQEERKRQEEDMMRRKQEEMQLRIVRQEEDMRRRQAENTLFMQAHQLNTLLDKQEQAMLGDEFVDPLVGEGYGRGGPGNLPVDPKAFMDSYDQRPSNNGRGGYDDVEMMDRDGMFDRDMDRGRFGNGNRGRWGGSSDYQSQGSRRGDNDFPNKRPRRH